MKKPERKKRGQFVIIAVMLVAIMIISIGALLHNAATYYKHEPWQEYSTLVSDIELNTRHLMELSLVEYTTNGSPDPSVLKDNLNKWQSDLSSIYPDKGVSLSFSMTQGPMRLYEQDLNFEQGLNNTWNKKVSSSAARANFTLGISSIGLSGYQFTAEVFLKTQIVSNSSNERTVDIVVYRENNMTISDLPDANFEILGSSINVTSSYSPSLGAIFYRVYYEEEPPTIVVTDQRGIRVVAQPIE